MRMFFVLIAGVLVGCGGVPFEPQQTCIISGFTVHTETYRECTDDELTKPFRVLHALVKDHAELHVLEEMGLEVEIFVLDTNDLTASESTLRSGTYSPANARATIQLSHSMTALLHELLHHYELTRLNSSVADAEDHVRFQRGGEWHDLVAKFNWNVLRANL